MSTDYEIFNAAERNDSKALKRLLDSGLDPNVRDYDRGATPLHLAANKGHIETIELLIDAGADVNATNKRGRSPIHALIEMRFYKIALWLIKYCGANVLIEDCRGLTPYDLAQPFMQKEIDECLKSIGQVHEEEAEPVSKPVQPQQQQQQYIATSSATSTKAPESTVYRVHLPSKSYKSVRINAEDSAETLLANLCDKLGLRTENVKFLVLFERVKDRERRVKPTEIIADIVKMWPTILGETGNETHKQCYFMAVPLSTAPEAVLKAINV